jgi:hypothetical protein
MKTVEEAPTRSGLITPKVVEGHWGLCQKVRAQASDDEATHTRHGASEWHFAYLVAKRFVEGHDACAHEAERGVRSKQVVVTEVTLRRPMRGPG